MRRLSLLLALSLSLPLWGEGPGAFLGKPRQKWVAELKSDRPERRRCAAFALGRLGEAAMISIPALVERVRLDPDAGVRDLAASAIGDILLDADSAPGQALWDDA